ncbi:MAG: PEP-CTERM sorting domain-containing protein [Desulfobulbaceae bacterium]
MKKIILLTALIVGGGSQVSAIPIEYQGSISDAGVVMMKTISPQIPSINFTLTRHDGLSTSFGNLITAYTNDIKYQVNSWWMGNDGGKPGLKPKNGNPIFNPRGKDNSTPVPEPATMFLFGAGLIGLAAIIRKKVAK